MDKTCFIYTHTHTHIDIDRERETLPQCLSWKESACNAGAAGDMGLIPELGRSPGGGHSNPLQYSCLENPHGQKSLVGYSL